MKRRPFLKLAAAATASALAAPYVHAQSKKFAGITLRINGYGGTYDESLMSTVVKPLEEKYGLKVQFIPGAPTTDMVKLIANRDNPPYDLIMGDSPHMVELIKAGVIDEIKVSEVSNVKRILPGFREFGDYGVPISIASIIPVYNSNYIKVLLTSYSDIAHPDLKDRVAIMSSSQTTNSLMLVALAEENGGSITNMEPAFKILAAARPNIAALPSTTVAQQQMYQNEEAYAGIFWDGRTWELRAKGTPMVTVVPPKGIYSVVTYVSPVKGMKYPDAARAYCEQLLSDQGMLGIPQTLRYGPTTDIKLPEALAKDLLFNSPERVALKKKVDWPTLMASRNAWSERFNKDIRI